MMNAHFLKKTAVFLFVSLLISCDKDYNTIGSDIVGAENFSTGTDIVDVKAFNQKVDAIQTNNLPINKLGIYSNPVFGNTRANFVTQLTLPSGSIKPTFTSHVVIDSVVLTVPYYSKFKYTNSGGANIYELDSIYPKNSTQTMSLKVYENGYYLRDFDPNDNLYAQKYYSNQDTDFNAAKIGTPLNTRVYNPTMSEVYNENDAFVPKIREYKKYKVDPTSLEVISPNETESRSTPRMLLRLDKNFFKTKIIDRAMNTATAGDFDNNNAFKDYFRGLYFQVQAASTGTMMSLDFTKGDVVIYYKQDKVKELETNPLPIVSKREMKTFTMTMSGNSVNLLENSGGTYLATVNSANPATGDETLFINGGQGSTAFIDIPAADILRIKNNKWLINDASITFTIDQSKIPFANVPFEPQRVYLYNAEKNRPVIDYFFDNSSNSQLPKYNKFIHGGIIENESSGNKRGVKYKIRITEHINNLVNKDSVNVRLGLMVTENVNEIRSVTLKNSVLLPNPFNPNKRFDRMPVSSITNPLGTAIYGTNIAPSNADYNKRIKLEIHYTKPN
jgi:Domain of unknown function (DUF4270)